MTLQVGHDGRPEVFTDQDGAYGRCIGIVTNQEAFDQLPPGERQRWEDEGGCGQRVPLLGRLADEPPPGFMCEDCGSIEAAVLKSAERPCGQTQPDGQVCSIPLQQGNRVIYSRRGAALHWCMNGHRTIVRFR
jgi:hypothetical protein